MKLCGCCASTRALSVRGLAGLKQQRIAFAGDGGRIEAEHQVDLERSVLARAVFGRGHEPVGRVKLVAAARSRLLRIHDESGAHEHGVPGTEVRHHHRHRPGCGIGRSSRSQVHQVHAGGIHFDHVHAARCAGRLHVAVIHAGHSRHRRHLRILRVGAAEKDSKSQSSDEELSSKHKTPHYRVGGSSVYGKFTRDGRRSDSED